MIELRNVSKYYNNDGIVTIGLRNINLNLNKNEIVAIVGDSGSGKSTLLNIICGIDTYDDGEMLFKGNETSYFSQNDVDLYRKNHIGFVFQNYNIIDSYTVLDNVMLPLILKGVETDKAEERAKELIEKVGLTARINNKGINLSGGEKQRCVIARALASDCDILACDEPTGNLDSKTSKEIIKLIQDVAKDKLVLIVTHNYSEVSDIVTRKIKIVDGEISENQVFEEIPADPNEKIIFQQHKTSENKLLKVVEKNITSTPKKTFLTFFVFLTISLIAFYLYLSCMSSSQTSVYNPDNSFSIYEYNRLIVFNYDHTALDDFEIDKKDGVSYSNLFYEDIPFSISLKTVNKPLIKIQAIYTKHPLTYNHLYGDKLTNVDDGYLILPYEQIDDYSLKTIDYIDSKMTLDDGTLLNFVGIGSSKYISNPVLISQKDIEKNVISMTYSNLYQAYFEFNGRTAELTRTYTTVDVPTIYLPYAYQQGDYDYDIRLVINNLYEVDFNDFNIEYTNGNSIYRFALPKDYQPVFLNDYEVTIYAERPNELEKELKNDGYTVIRPSIDYVETSQNQLLFYTYVLLSTLIIFVLSFVSYIILSRIYVSKNKEYTVFRTLGILKKDMSVIVSLEIMLIAIAATILGYAIIYILYFTIESEYLNVVRYNNFLISMIYFVVMIYFSYYISKKFNKKLFKYSVQTTFKGEAVKND